MATLRQDIIEIIYKINNAPLQQLNRNLNDLNQKNPAKNLQDSVQKAVAPTDKLRSSTDKLKTSTNEAGKEGKQLGDDFTSGSDKASGGIKNLMASMVGANLITSGIQKIGSGLKSLVTSGLSYNSEMEQLQASFTTMLGSNEKAIKLSNDLKEMGAKTPFETSDLAEATKVMLGFGMSADESKKYLQILGDVSQGNKDKLNSLTLSFSQVTSAGKLMGGDLLQMINAGFNPLNEISKKTGKSIGELKKDMEAGAISADMVKGAFESATQEGGLFFGAMDKQSQTMAGQMSTLSDNVKTKLGEMSMPFSTLLAGTVIPIVSQFIGSFNSASIVDFVNKIVEKLILVGSFISKLSSNEVLISIITSAFETMKDRVSSLIEIVGKVIDKITEFASRPEVINVVTTAFDQLNKISTMVWDTCTGLINFFLDNFSTIEPYIWGIIGAMVAWKAIVLAHTIGTKALALVEGIKTGVLIASTVAQWAANAAILACPVTWIVLAIMAVIAAVILLIANWDKVGPFLYGLWVKIKEVFAKLGEFFAGLPSKLWAWLLGAIAKLIAWGEQMKIIAGQKISEMINAVITFFSTLPYKIGFFLGFIIGKIVQFGINIVTWAMVAIPNFINSIITFFSQLPSKIWNFLVFIITYIVTWGQMMIAYVRYQIPIFINNVLTFFGQLPSKIWNFFMFIITYIVTWVQMMIAYVRYQVPLFINNVLTFFRELPGKIWSAIIGVLSNIVSWVQSMIDTARREIPKFISNVIDFFSGIVDKIEGVGKSIVTGIWDGVTSKISWLGDKISGFASGIVDGFKSAIKSGSPSKLFADVAKSIPQGIAIGVKADTGKAIESIQSMTGSMETSFNATSNPMLSAYTPETTGTNNTTNTTTSNNTTYSPSINVNVEGGNASVGNIKQAVFAAMDSYFESFGRTNSRVREV